MSNANHNDPFEEEMYSELAEVLFLGEPVPEHLQPLWAHVAQHPECLAKLEEYRVWDRRMAEALQNERTSLVLTVMLVAAAWQIQVRRKTGGIGQFRGITTPEDARGRRGATSIVEFDGFAVEVEPLSDAVKLTIFSGRFETTGLEVQVQDLDGQCLDRGITDVRGSVTLKVPSRKVYEVVVQWSEGKAR